MTPLRLALALLLASPFAGADENLLKNGEFESGGKGPPVNWSTIWPRQIQDPAPTFERSEVDPRSGDGCGVITTTQPGGYTSYTQEVRVDDKATLLRLTGWIRVDELQENSSASFLMLLMDSKGEMLTARSSRKLSETGEWTELEVEVPMPEGTKSVLFRCGVTGAGSVAFDDVELVNERLSGEHIATQLSAHFGTYVVRAKNKAKEPWVALSIPFPFERQVPLALRVTSEPPDQVARLEVLEDGDNRPLRVYLVPQERDSEVRLRVETLTWIADRPVSTGEGVALPKKRIPKDVKEHLEPAVGIDLAADAVKDAAKEFDRTDFASLMKDVAGFLSERLTYAGGSPTQGAEECLSSGKAVCTGFANTAASLLIASGLPTRILASTQLDGRLQEHYIIETWTPDLGWSRFESTMARFPWEDSKNLILRVVTSDAFRNSGDVPIYVQTGGGGTGGFWMDPKDSCWQGANLVASPLVPAGEFDRVHEAAAEAFEGLRKRPAESPRTSLLPTGKDLKKLKLGKRSSAVLLQVETWLAE